MIAARRLFISRKGSACIRVRVRSRYGAVGERWRGGGLRLGLGLGLGVGYGSEAIRGDWGDMGRVEQGHNATARHKNKARQDQDKDQDERNKLRQP
jgi:hypothetical protein